MRNLVDKFGAGEGHPSEGTSPDDWLRNQL